MKTPILALAGISLLAGTAALAQPGDRNPGPMTRAEVSQKTAERFQRMDMNSDGVLDLADRELRREQRRPVPFVRRATQQPAARRYTERIRHAQDQPAA